MKHRERQETPAEQIYFVLDEAAGAFEIGTSADPRGRLNGLQVGNPSELSMLGTIPGGRDEESRLHDFFAPHRARGEWFRASPEVLLAVRRLLGRTVGAELARRRKCRMGLRGVTVATIDDPDRPLAVLDSYWNAAGRLYLDLRAGVQGGEEIGVSADACLLLSDWPTPCPCWQIV
jgi:hypothetical protein